MKPLSSRHSFLTLLILLLMQGVIMPAQAQEDYTFKRFNVDNGLSSNYVVDIDQDKQGCIWIATESGLNKFDGTEVTIYNTQNSTLSSNELNTVYCDTLHNTVWVGTQRYGISVYDCLLQRFTHNYNTSNGLISNDVTDICHAADGGIWITHYHLGLEHFDPATGQLTPWRMSDIKGFEGKSWCTCDDGNGHIYVGHDGQGLSLIDMKTRTCRKFLHKEGDPQSLPGNIVHAIFIDKDKRVWVGTDNGLALFNPHTGTFTSMQHDDSNPRSLISNYVYDIGQSADGRIWICTQMGGVSVLDPEGPVSPENVRFHNIGTGQGKGIASPNTRCFFQDSFGNIWIGNYRQGVDFLSYEPPTFQILSPSVYQGKILSDRQVWSIAFDDHARLWAGGENKLVVYYGQKTECIISLTGHASPHTHVSSIYTDSKGKLWLGLYEDGVLQCDPATQRITRIQAPQKHLNVHGFYEDRDGIVWVATYNGAYICRDGRLEARNDINSQLPDRMLSCITRDHDGNLWLGTFGKGLVKFDRNYTLQCTIDETNGLGSNAVNHCFIDSKGGLWVATRNGLAHLPDPAHPEKVYLYGDHEGLENIHVRAVAEDNEGEIWLSTNGGISHWNSKTQRFDNYTHDEGVPKGDFMDAAVCKSRDGRLYFGSQEGVCCFSPTDIPHLRPIAPVVITEIKSYSSDEQQKNHERIIPRPDDNRIRLAYDENTFDIAFNVIDYTQSPQVEYAYLMEGLHTAWFETGNDHRVMFRNLPPGEYIFHVKAHLRNQPWSDRQASVSIRITHPWWSSWYAKTVYILLACMVLYIIIRFYKHRLDLESRLNLERHQHENDQKLSSERLRFYTNITHELRTPLTLIMGPLEDLLADKTLSPKHANRISLIRDSATRLLNLINQLLEFRKTETENRRLCVEHADLGKLVQEIGLRYKELNTNNKLDFDIRCEGHHMLYFDPEILTIILDNLLSNAIKYTPEGRITLSVGGEETPDGKPRTVIRVSDTGYGISPQALPHIFERYYQENGDHQASGSGIGLALVKSLVELHQGTITAESTAGEGSTFTVSLPTDCIYPDALHKETHTESKPDTAQPGKADDGDTDDNRPILLVVEDNKDIREYIRTSFEDRYEVLTAADGQEGWDIARQRIPDIIVSDIMMPVMDGVALCRLVKQDVSTSHIPVILLTAKDSSRDKEEGYAAGADSYLNKPFSTSLLSSRIDNLLDNRRRLAHLITASHTGEDEATPHHTEAVETLSKLDRDFLDKVNRIIADHLNMERMDMAFIADKMCMSHSTLYRKVKALTGMPLNELVRDAKMCRAAELLDSGEYTVADVSDMTGFSSVPYFRQRFKEKYGMSPSDYMRRKRKA